MDQTIRTGRLRSLPRLASLPLVVLFPDKPRIVHLRTVRRWIQRVLDFRRIENSGIDRKQLVGAEVRLAAETVCQIGGSRIEQVERRYAEQPEDRLQHARKTRVDMGGVIP